MLWLLILWTVSGIRALQEALHGQFAARADQLKAHTAIGVLSSLAVAEPVAGIEEVRRDLERIAASTHEFAELRLLGAIRMGRVELTASEVEDVERLLGVKGEAAHRRVGLGADVAAEEVVHRAAVELDRWHRKAEHPLTPVTTADAARVLIRTCEGIVAALTLPAG